MLRRAALPHKPSGAPQKRRAAAQHRV